MVKGRIWMKKIICSFGLLLILSGFGADSLLASDITVSTPAETPTSGLTFSATETPTLPKPMVLKGSDKMNDSENHSIPPPPKKDSDGNSIGVKNSDQIPRGKALNNLTDPSILFQIPDFNKSEDKSKTYNWHPVKGEDYCHYRDGSSNHWYGWRSEVGFLWVLYRAGNYWWHDTYAERWLYFNRGFWWWQGSKKNQFQVYLEDGHYHAIDANGTLGDDLFTTGTEEVVTEPFVKETVVPLSKQQKEEGDPRSGSGQGGLDTFNRH
jgi:hypothetical protein